MIGDKSKRRAKANIALVGRAAKRERLRFLAYIDFKRVSIEQRGRGAVLCTPVRETDRPAPFSLLRRYGAVTAVERRVLSDVVAVGNQAWRPIEEGRDVPVGTSQARAICRLTKASEIGVSLGAPR